jgi:hypothetical protein
MAALAGLFACDRRTTTTEEPEGPSSSDGEAPLDAAEAPTPAPQIPVVTSLPPPPPAYMPDASAFEGEVDFALTEKGARSVLQYVIQGVRTSATFMQSKDKVRFLVLPDEQRSVMIDDKARVYEKKVWSAGGTPAGVTQTERHERLAGAECEIWEVDRLGERFSACVARGIGPFTLDRILTAARWGNTLTADGYFALRTVAYDASGAEIQRVEATKIVRRPVDESTFAVPTQYKNVSEHGL